MIRGGIKGFAEGVKQLREVSNKAQRYQFIHGGIKEFTGGGG